MTNLRFDEKSFDSQEDGSQTTAMQATPLPPPPPPPQNMYINLSRPSYI